MLSNIYNGYIQLRILFKWKWNHFSHVQLFATSWIVACKAPPSMGFSRQEYCSGLPFPSPVHESQKWKWSCSAGPHLATQSCPTLCDPMDCSLPGSFVHGISQARILEWGSIAFSVGKPSHVYHAPGEHHGLRSVAGYSPKGFKDWATKHVSMHASHNRGCHCWTKVSKSLNAEITGERRSGETGW